MFNIPPLKTTEAIKAQLLPGPIKTWKVGQILYGRAETGGPALSNIILRIGELRLQAQTPVDIQEGESLKLLVKELGETPLLSIQGKVDPGSQAAEQLKLFIAQQGSTRETLLQLKSLQALPQLPDTVRQSLDKLLQQLPDIQQATRTHSLKQLVQDNGIFLESRLLHQADSRIQNNLKAQLINIRQQLFDAFPALQNNVRFDNNTEKNLQNILQQFQQGQIDKSQLIRLFLAALPSTQINKLLQMTGHSSGANMDNELHTVMTQFLDAIKQQPHNQQYIKQLNQQLQFVSQLHELKTSLDSLLNKITTQQLIPLSRDPDNALLLIFSLLLKDNRDFYPIDLKIEAQPGKDKKNKKDWLINIKFELGTMGIIQCRLHLLEMQLSSFFQAEKKSTMQHIRKHLPDLDKSLRHAGFDVMQLGIEKFSLKPQPEYPRDIQILDEEA